MKRKKDLDSMLGIILASFRFQMMMHQKIADEIEKKHIDWIKESFVLEGDLKKLEAAQKKLQKELKKYKHKNNQVSNHK
jgi:uncharacterized protein YlxW (UPF0749 family)